jgi:hypothetical protein
VPWHLVATLAAFGLAVGVGAHCLDELHGRPLRTRIPDRALVALAAISLLGAVALGLVGARERGPWMLVAIAAGVGVCVAYNLELAAGVLHGDLVFALSWGGFPVVVGCYAQGGQLTLAAVLASAFAVATSLAQRRLSTFSRDLRRGRVEVAGTAVGADGAAQPLTVALLTAHADAALRLLAAAHVTLAVAVLADRL